MPTEIETLRDEVHAQVGTIARQDRLISGYEQRILILERNYLLIQATGQEHASKIGDLEIAAGVKRSLRARFASQIRSLANKMEEL